MEEVHEQTMASISTPLKLGFKKEEKEEDLQPDSPCESEVSMSSSTASATVGEKAPYHEDGVLDDEEEEESDEKGKDEISSILRILLYLLAFSLGVFGLLDMLAALLPSYVLVKEESDDDTKKSNNENGSGVGQNVTDDDYAYDTEPVEYEYPQGFLYFVRWLDDHHLAINFLFSILWFVTAFVHAGMDRNKALRKTERKRLELQKKIRFWETPNFVYCRTMIFQLMVLPIGFYFIIYTEIQRLSLGEDIELLDSMDDGVIEIGSFSSPVKRTLLTAVVHHYYHAITGKSARLAKANAISLVRSAAPKLVGKMIRRPRQFRRRIRKAMRAIRWFQYLAPLIGTCNKLKGNLADLRKKARQRMEAEKYRRAKQILFAEKPLEIQREEAATIIQSAFRSYYSRKATRALKLIQGDREHFAALKVQKQFRRKLAEARERLKKKKEELAKLERMKFKKLSDDEKIRMYELQDEIGQEANELLNRKLLLRPNTQFAVVWKYLFVVCVMFEISGLAIKPWLTKAIKTKKNGVSSVGEFVARAIVPTRISELTECQKFHKGLTKIEARMPLFCNGDCQLKLYKYRQERVAELKKDQVWYCKEPVSTAQEHFTDVMALLFIPSEVSEWPECDIKSDKKRGNRRQLPWYCAEPYSQAHAIYRDIITFIVEEFLLFVSAVCFLDVFVTFFTGELHPENGTLIPKPFFPRWILPGLILQLLVNPNIATVSGHVWRAWNKLLMLGPARVFRWFSTVFFPIIYFGWKALIDSFWLPLVQRENMIKAII